MKVIFLDFDGVLNSDRYIARQGGGMAIDPEKLVLIKHLVDATDARIVLTTSWRTHWDRDLTRCDSTGQEMTRLFSACGLEIWDKTPQLQNREAEIRAWLDAHPETSQFAVLDDRLLSAPFLREHFVKTSNYFGGLEEGDVKKAAEILKSR